MEMMKGQNSKRFTLQEITEKGEVDRISALVDCLLLEILSRLPSTKDAIRTGTLSKRWKHLWTLVPSLIFIEPWPDLNWYADETNLRSDFFSFVDNTLTQCRQSKLKKFQVEIGYDIFYETQVKNWIRYAISCNVEELALIFMEVILGAEFQADQVLYVSSCLTDLRLTRCRLTPIGAISWKNLSFLRLQNVELDEDMIEKILSGSPVLETLVLRNCYGYRLLNITSKSVKKLLFCGYNNFDEEYDDSDEELDDIIEINAPYISSLTIQNELLLWKLVLLNLSSLVETDLYYEKLGYSETTFEEAEEETLKGFVQKLSHVKVLKIGDICSKVVTRLAAKGFVFPTNVKFSDY